MADRAPLNDLLRVEDLHVQFATPAGAIRAVRGVSFRMRPATTLAVVGESGSGKSVLSQSILRILPRNGAITQGRDPVRRSARCRGADRPGATAGRRAADAGDPRRPHLDHLSGADEFAVAAAYDRRPGQRGAAAASPRHGRRGQGADSRDAAPGRLSRRSAGLAQLSVRAVGRSAAARDDRDGAGLPAGPADRRRADDRSRRDDPGADPEADRRVAAANSAWPCC